MLQRADVEQLTTQHGGTYSGDLVMEKCTHLLADSTQSKKFEFATRWKIPCVKSKWLYDSIERVSAVTLVPKLSGPLSANFPPPQGVCL